jgi:riboflavin biosynthesis pyrimidine reductase
VRQIFTASGLRESDLAGLYAYPSGSWLRANMVASADGAAQLTGVTSGLSSEADRRLFALLRTLADVIVVGAGTVRAENYKPVRQHELWPDLRAGRTPTPPIAVVTARLDLTPSSPVIDMAPPSARTIVITTAQAPADRRAALEERADVIVAGQDTVNLKAAIGALADRGHRRMLAEGGPRLLAQIAAAGLLDELCLTVGPLLAGPGADRILAGGPFAAPQPLSLAHVLEDNGFLFCRYTRKDLLSRTARGACRRSRDTAYHGAHAGQSLGCRRRPWDCDRDGGTWWCGASRLARTGPRETRDSPAPGGSGGGSGSGRCSCCSACCRWCARSGLAGYPCWPGRHSRWPGTSCVATRPSACC